MGKAKATDIARVESLGNWLSAGLVVAVVLGLAVGQHLLRRTISQGPHPEVRVAFAWPLVTQDGKTMTWMSEPIRRSIERVALLNLTADPLDSTSLKLTADALGATGWFEGVPTVRREPGAMVTVTGAWRAPVAVVRHAAKDHLVSAKGRLLPLSYSIGASGLKFIENPYSPPPAEAGAPWTGGDVEAALSLLGVLQDTPADAQVAGIDVSEYVTKKKLVIVTDRGNRVVWGAGPLDWAPAEPTREVKLQRLLALRADAKFGWRIDADQALIDLTSPRGIMIQRASAAADAGDAGPDAPTPSRSRTNPQAQGDRHGPAGGGVRTASRDR